MMRGFGGDFSERVSLSKFNFGRDFSTSSSSPRYYYTYAKARGQRANYTGYGSHITHQVVQESFIPLA